MKAITTFLLLLLGVLKVANTFSQQAVDTTKIITHWEIGLNLLPLINKQVMEYNILIKRNYKKGAIRLRPIFNAQYSPNQQGFSNFDNKRLELGIFLGHEWRKKLSSKFFIIYGGELGYARIKKKDFVLDDPNGSVFYTVLYTHHDNALANIFIGPKAMLTRSISISVETTLSTVWTKVKSNTDRYQTSSSNDPDLLINSRRSGYSSWYKKYNLIPIYAINFSYQF